MCARGFLRDSCSPTLVCYCCGRWPGQQLLARARTFRVSSNPDIERNMDLTALVTLIDEFVTHGTKFKLCALVFQRITDLAILSRPKTKRGTRAGRLHRLWHCLSPCLVHHAVTPPLCHPSPVVNQVTTPPPLCHPSSVVNQATTPPPHRSPVVNQATTPSPLCQSSPVVNQATTPPPLCHPFTSVSIFPSGQPGDYLSTSPLRCGQPGNHPSTAVTPPQ